ncbi:MAG TPA: DUF5658 family protein [Steroidobacteraceae bacterium]|nr:DUF5658 family protein [Steroidobacteraceae bacterium]
MTPTPPTSSTSPSLKPATERRVVHDRRRRVVRALLAGSFVTRRRGPRRLHDRSVASTDWHHPQWLAVGLAILLFSVADAFFTLTLLGNGAWEANPFMAPLVHGDAHLFAATKIGLTAGGVVALIVLVRMRAFGRIPVSAVLYGVLAAYAALVGYEYWLMQQLPVI